MTGYFLRQSEKRQYDLMGALRGPDHNENSHTATLKAIITARIRAIIFGRRGSGAWCWQRLSRHDLKRVSAANTALRESHQIEHNHFLGHLWSAVMASRRHRIWGGHGDALLAALQKRAEAPKP